MIATPNVHKKHIVQYNTVFSITNISSNKEINKPCKIYISKKYFPKNLIGLMSIFIFIRIKSIRATKAIAEINLMLILI